jgi:hypothetical protein
MNTRSSVPYSVVTEGALSFFKEDVPLWVIMLLIRVHHFNSRRQERYTLYLEKESLKLRVRPENIIAVLDEMASTKDLIVEKANAGLYLVLLSDDLRKNIDMLC